MKIKGLVFYILLIMALGNNSYAQFTRQEQNQLDSLNTIIKNKSSHDTLVAAAYISLSEMLAASNIDTVIYLCTKAQELIQKNLSNQSDLKIRKSLKISLAAALNNMGYVHMNKVNLPLALEYYKKSIIVEEDNGNIQGLASAYNNIGLIYFNKGDIPSALEYYHKSLKIKERYGDKKGIAYSYNNIGYVYLDQGNFPLALDYYEKSLKIREEIGDKNGMAQSFNNIGNIYHKSGKILLALEYFNKSLKIREETNDKKGVAYAFNNIGLVHNDHGNMTLALDFFNKALKKYEEIEDKEGMAYTFHRIGSLKFKTGEVSEAKKYAEKGLVLAKEIGFPSIIELNAKLLSQIAIKQGLWKEAYEMRNLEILMRDSLASISSIKASANQQAKYEYEKQAAIDSIAHSKKIEIKDLELGKQRAENRKQQIIIISAIAGFITILAFSIFLLRLFRQKRKANILLALQNTEIRQQREEISTQRDLVTLQKEQIEEIYKEVTDSINYAKRIQEAVLPVSDSARSILGEHFVLFKPKDIVSGDFYFTTKIKNWLIVAVADCTGHGVPGAFMSMLGISFLNEIVQKQEINKANQILNRLRIEIINALQQKGLSGEQKDGMDISLLVINTDTNECQWAGANNPLYIVRKPIKSESEKSVETNFQLSDIGLYELKGDKMPIAIYPEMRDFTNHEFSLQKGDCVYLFTDGYADQFGGTKGRKFMYKQFKHVLESNCDKPMLLQGEILELTFNDWKGRTEQIDDVTIIGMRI